jgi:hypothetical protein
VTLLDVAIDGGVGGSSLGHLLGGEVLFRRINGSSQRVDVGTNPGRGSVGDRGQRLAVRWATDGGHGVVCCRRWLTRSREEEGKASLVLFPSRRTMTSPPSSPAPSVPCSYTPGLQLTTTRTSSDSFGSLQGNPRTQVGSRGILVAHTMVAPSQASSENASQPGASQTQRVGAADEEEEDLWPVSSIVCVAFPHVSLAPC